MIDRIFTTGFLRSFATGAAALTAMAVLAGCVPGQPGAAFGGGQVAGPVQPPAEFECPAIMRDAPNIEREFTCHCGPVEPSSLPLMVVGTDIYDAGSRLCLAGVHSGAIGWSGGNISVVPRGHRRDFHGSQRNGVSSDSMSAFDNWSFSFVGY